jgi:hypothetical protein
VRPFPKVFLAMIFAVATAGFLSASDIYVAENAAGGNTGADCADAHSAAWLNSSSNWGSGVGQVGPGTTVHLCGTFTGAAGATMLTIQGSGSSGNPIIIKFEDGTLLTSPQWGSSSSGAINCSGQNYITIDGGTNGIIQNTASGSGLSYTGDSEGIYATSCSNFTAQNIDFENLWVRLQSDTSFNSNGTAAFQDLGTLTNVTFQNNTVNHCRFAAAYSYAGTSSNLVFSGNTMNFVETSLFAGDMGSNSVVNGVTINGNSTKGGSYLWDGNSGFHHDPLTHVFAVSSGSQVNNLVISNNQGTGTYTLPGGPNTSWIFLEGGISSPQVFNNVMTSLSNDAGFSNGFFGVRGNTGAVTNFVLYNNTFRGNSDSNTIGGGNCIRITGGPSSTGTIENNIFDNCGIAGDIEDSTVTSDYNYYYNFGSSNFGSTFLTWTQWQSAGNDAHGICGRTGGTEGGCPNGGDPLSGVTGPPYTLPANSPAIGAATNLTGLGIKPLDFDMAAVARPSSGNWDASAYQVSTGPPPNPPTGLAAVVN